MREYARCVLPLSFLKMNKNYSVFVDQMYYYDFVALYNSWKYYECKVPIKVYSHANLSLERKKIISKHCELIEVKNTLQNKKTYKYKYLFKFLGILENMSDNEILLDADTIMLSNMDHLFDLTNEGLFFSVEEFSQKLVHGFHCKNSEEWAKEYLYVQNILKKHVPNHYEKYNINTRHPVYNAGLYGLNKKTHSELLQKSIEILQNDGFNSKNAVFQTEQYVFSFLAHLFDIPIVSLPPEEWMNTWDRHKVPKKNIIVNNGKLNLYNENGTRVNFYHFTGGIGMIHNKMNLEMSCRPHQIFETQPYEVYFNKKDVYNMWLEKHENPVILLYEMFARMGMN